MILEVESLLENAEKELKNFDDQVSDYLLRYGNDVSEYLIYRRLMQSYYLGCVASYKECIKLLT